uniref:Retrovirus-related Pol polyprotein from transposon TNT 1-94 n=1 Tax=Tanacetum cinerariifolium TaxID=118510 RepID=A0A6L2JP28_TANCI|nr:retrovirus-related Pol polyprotein from transposon TNT 1-94 [Tanacetum cinerariifolium]
MNTFLPARDHVPVFVPEFEHPEDLVLAEDEAPASLLPLEFLSPRTPSLLPIPLSTPSTSRRAGIPEADTPPRNRPLLATLRPGCEVVESSAAAARQLGPTMAHGVDCSYKDRAAVRAEIEVLRSERLAYEQEGIQTCEALARSEAYCRALGARVVVLETHAPVRAEIEVLRSERLAYEQEGIQTCEALARSEAYCRALGARVIVLETHARRLEWQRQATDDLAVQHIMRTQALEAGACDDTLEDTARFTKIHVANTTVEARCLALEAELANLRDTNNHDNQKELINHFSKLKVTNLQAQNSLFRAENDKIKQHYKELYDSIKITRAKYLDRVTKLTTENVNLKTRVSKDEVNPQVPAREERDIDVEPIVPYIRNNKDAHIDYLRHLKKCVETIRDIIKEAKVFAHIPLIRKKQVTISKPSDKSDSTTHRHVVTVKSQQTNVPVPSSTGVNSCPNASGSQPKSNVKPNRISPVKGVNKLPVEDQPRTNKSHLRTSNRVDSSRRLKRTVNNLNSDSICQTCNKCLTSSNHDMCVATCLQSVVEPPSIRHNYDVVQKVIQIVLLYLDSGCSKHMTEDRSRLMNFVKKFIGTVRFRNDHFGAIMGYEDYMIEVVATACYTQNRSLIHTRHHKTPYERVHNKKPDLTFFRVFGALCYPTNDSKDLGNLQPTVDTGIFVGPRTKFGSCNSLCTPTNKELEILFQPMFDEYLEPPRTERPVPPAQAEQAPVNSAGIPSSTTIDQDAPTPSISPSSSSLQSHSLHQGVTAKPNYIEDHTIAPVDNNPFVNVFAPEPHSEASLSGDISSTESPYVSQTLHHLNKWSKDHPLDNVIGNPSRPVSTRKQLATDALWC